MYYEPTRAIMAASPRSGTPAGALLSHCFLFPVVTLVSLMTPTRTALSLSSKEGFCRVVPSPARQPVKST